MNKSAIKWYSENYGQLLMKLLKHELENESDFPRLARELRDKAMDMERQQIIDAVESGYVMGNVYYDDHYSEDWNDNASKSDDQINEE